jgi:hypothetical protein
MFTPAISCHVDPAMKGFLVLAGAVVVMGGLVGGVLALLLPKAASGFSLGAIIALFISSVSKSILVNMMW